MHQHPDSTHPCSLQAIDTLECIRQVSGQALFVLSAPYRLCVCHGVYTVLQSSLIIVAAAAAVPSVVAGGMFDCDGDRREFAHKQYMDWLESGGEQR